MKKILVIFTGGTIASTVNNGIIDIKENQKYELINRYLLINNNISFETLEPYFILSENLSVNYIMKLVNSVQDNIDKGYDGIIITHGTDTLQYSASAVKIALGEIKIPVLLVSSNYPLSDARSNGFANFCGAVSFIENNIDNGVFVSYKNTNEEIKFFAPETLLDYDCFSDVLRSINCRNDSPAKIDNLELDEKQYVIRLKAYPGMIYPTLKPEVKAVVIDTYHSGTLKTDDNSFFEFINDAKTKNIPIVLTGVTDKIKYKSTEIFSEFDNLFFSPFAPIYTYVKTLFFK